MQYLTILASLFNACAHTQHQLLLEDGGKGLHGFESWPTELPWLYYNLGDSPEFREDVVAKGTFDHDVCRTRLS